MAKLFGVKVICPEKVFFDGEAEMLELKTTEGEIGIFADHIPLTAVVEMSCHICNIFIPLNINKTKIKYDL